MTALEAKRLTENNLSNLYNDELGVIYEYVKKHSEKGEFCCTILRSFNKNILQKLKDDGYHVISICDKLTGKYLTTINWELPQAPPIIEWPATTHSKGI